MKENNYTMSISTQNGRYFEIKLSNAKSLRSAQILATKKLKKYPTADFITIDLNKKVVANKKPKNFTTDFSKSKWNII